MKKIDLYNIDEKHRQDWWHLVSVFGWVILGRHDQTSSLPGSPVDSLHDVNQLLLVLHGPVDLVIVTSSQVDHDVFVSIDCNI